MTGREWTVCALLQSQIVAVFGSSNANLGRMLLVNPATLHPYDMLTHYSFEALVCDDSLIFSFPLAKPRPVTMSALCRASQHAVLAVAGKFVSSHVRCSSHGLSVV